MKIIFSFIAPLLFLAFSFLGINAFSQTANHPTIKSFAITYLDGDQQSAPSLDSAVIVIYVVTLKDTINVNKVCARVSSSQQTNGNLLNGCYTLNSPDVLNNAGAVMYWRRKEVVYIRTISTTQQANDNFEVCTEDLQGQKSFYVNWRNN